MKFLDKASSFHLEKVEIFLSDGLISGIGVTFSLDAIKVSNIHQGKKRAKTSYALELDREEHIDFL